MVKYAPIYAPIYTGPNDPVAPTVATAPSLTGVAKVGLVIVRNASTWNGYPAPAVTWKWQKSTNGGTTWTDIPDAPFSNYTPKTEDVGALIRVTDTATNASGNATSSSPASAAVAAAD